jgi:hypothetical protein
MPSRKDVEVLRTLGRQVAEIAALPQQQRTIDLWKAVNDLKPVRPMVMIDQVCWHEMNVDGELTNVTEDKACQGIEAHLRRKLYRWKHMSVDYVVEPRITVWPAVSGMEFGLSVSEDRAVLDPQNSVIGHLYHDQLRTEDDLEKIKMPHLQHDEVATAGKLAWTREIFDGILAVEVDGIAPMYNLWDQIVCWRGVEAVLMDMADRPEFLRKLMARLTRAYTSQLDQLEAMGLLARPQSWVHCTGAFTNELPAPGYDPAKPRAKDIWTAGMAQIFGSVSPAMHQEFDLDYLNPIYQRFGRVYYGCCEPLHLKMDLVTKIPNVRKVSMSPWVNVEIGAEKIGRSLVFSRKPSPAILARDGWDLAAAEADLKETIEACKRHGCPLELILKDISTVRYEPQRLWQWADTAMKLVRS